MFGNLTVSGTVGTRQLSPGYSDTPASTPIVEILAPFDYIIDQLHVIQNASGGNGQSSQYTLFVNGAPTPVTLPMPSNASTSFTLLPSVSGVRGDRLRFEQTVAVDLGIPLGLGGVVATMRMRELP